MMPVFVPDVDEVDPLRVVRQKRMTSEVIAENIFQIEPRLRVRHLLKLCARPSRSVALHYEGACRLVEFIGVCGEDASVCLVEGERQSVKELTRSVPDIFVRAHAQLRHERSAVLLSHGAVDSV